MATSGVAKPMDPGVLAEGARPPTTRKDGGSQAIQSIMDLVWMTGGGGVANAPGDEEEARRAPKSMTDSEHLLTLLTLGGAALAGGAVAGSLSRAGASDLLAKAAGGATAGGVVRTGADVVEGRASSAGTYLRDMLIGAVAGGALAGESAAEAARLARLQGKQPSLSGQGAEPVLSEPVPPRSILSQPGGLSSTEGRVVVVDGKAKPPTHPLSKHGPGVKDESLLERLAKEPKTPEATRFGDRARMESAIGQTINANSSEIQSWLKKGAKGKLALTGKPKLGKLGEGFKKMGDKVVRVGSHRKVRVVLASDGKGGYVIHTAYPVR
ncbi:MAG TPA: RNase A-like domain-containing protein [Gemmatimonadales bacterium]|nr:RNase A-like domain-containing protein [Gemmatimonadales bacterium]